MILCNCNQEQASSGYNKTAHNFPPYHSKMRRVPLRVLLYVRPTFGVCVKLLTGFTPHGECCVPLPRFGVVRETPANLTSRPAGNVAPPLLPYGLSSPVSPPHRKCFRRGPRDVLPYSQNAGLTLYEYQNFWYRTHITKRKTVPTEIPARFTPPKILSAGAPRGGIRRSHTYARVYLGIRLVRRD